MANGRGDSAPPGRWAGPRLPRLAPAELVHILTLPTSSMSARFSPGSNPKTRSFAELLIDCEEDRTLRAVLVGMLRESERK